MTEQQTATARPEGYPATPNLDRMSAVHEQSQAIGAFLEATDYTLCEWTRDKRWGDPGQYQPVSGSIEQILAKHFGVDLAEADREKQAVLEWLQSIL